MGRDVCAMQMKESERGAHLSLGGIFSRIVCVACAKLPLWRMCSLAICAYTGFNATHLDVSVWCWAMMFVPWATHAVICTTDESCELRTSINHAPETYWL